MISDSTPAGKNSAAPSDLDRAIYRGRLRLEILDLLEADASRTLAEVLRLQRERLLSREGSR